MSPVFIELGIPFLQEGEQSTLDCAIREDLLAIAFVAILWKATNALDVFE